jgi:hypothetical protein
MEKEYSHPEMNAADMSTLKVESSTGRDGDFDQVLEVESTPELQRKVLLKLDLL